MKNLFLLKFYLCRGYNKLYIEKNFLMDNIFEYIKSIFKLSFFHVLRAILIENIFL